MIITKFPMALDQRGVDPVVDAVQDDSFTRAVEIALTYKGQPWEIPSDTTAAIRFKKPDGKKGLYDTLPDKEAAYKIDGNVVTVTLAPEVLTAEGRVDAAVALYQGNKVLGLFPFIVSVAPNPGSGQSISNNYYYLQTWDDVNAAIRDLEESTGQSLFNVNEMFMALKRRVATLENSTGESFNELAEENAALSGRIDDLGQSMGQGFRQVNEAVNELHGRVSDLEKAPGLGGGGITKEEKSVILALFKGAAYTADMSAKVAELEALWSVSHKASYNLTGVTASNNASAVIENGTYTTTLTAESGYTLTGATVKVTMGGVDITSTAYSNGVITIASVTGAVVISVVAKEVATYSITNNLTGVTNSNSATKVTQGDFYSASLSWDSAYTLNSIVITMGGVDITAEVYGEGSILITEVTGDIVITAEAGIPVLYQLANTPVACNADLYEDTGLTIGASDATLYAKNWTLCAIFTRTASGEKILAAMNNSIRDSFAIRSYVSNSAEFPLVYWCKGNTSIAVQDGTASKIVITHEAKSSSINVYAASAGGLAGKVSPTYATPAFSDYAGTLYVGGGTEASFIGTIEDFTIYGAVMSEADIKAYLGVE